MFPFPIAKPQGCDIQTFYSTSAAADAQRYAWNKPVGVSHVYMLLIGGGGYGDGTQGGGSGGVTVWYGAAQHVPNSLIILPGSITDGNSTNIYYQSRSTTQIVLLSATTGSTTGGTAVTGGPFAASGFYRSTAGQDGTAGTPSVSAFTFLGGGGGQNNNATGNYGYESSTNGSGFFQLKPIIVGVGGSYTARAGVGCGGGSNGTYPGGPGMVLIASW